MTLEEKYDTVARIAAMADLDVVETTTAWNDHAENTALAIVSDKRGAWDVFEEILESEEGGLLETVELTNMGSYRLWHREHKPIRGMFTPTARDYGYGAELVGCWAGFDETAYIREKVIPFLDSFDSMEDLAVFVNAQNEIVKHILMLRKGETVLVRNGEYESIVKIQVMSFDYANGMSKRIGLALKEDNVQKRCL